MKTWIIVLSIVYVVLRLVYGGIGNFIRNDREERAKYYFANGATKLGVLYGLFKILATLVLCAAIVLAIIFVLGLL